MLIRNAALSDLGRSRRVNEDFYFLDPSGEFFLVADGMGGHGNGEIASRVAAQAMARYLADNSRSVRPWSSPADRVKRNADRLRLAVRAANLAVLGEVDKNGALAGMGATLVSFLADGDKALIAHVGDSRAYRLRSGELEQLTEDHTWVHEQVSAGLLSEEEARHHPFRSVVTRAVGGAEEVEVDVDVVDLQPGDRLLLCSDGLNAVLSDDEIAAYLLREKALEDLVRQLVDAANNGGGPDNITVVVLDVTE